MEAQVDCIGVFEWNGVVLMEVEVLVPFPCCFGGDMRYYLVPVKKKLVKMKVFLVRVFMNFLNIV